MKKLLFCLFCVIFGACSSFDECESSVELFSMIECAKKSYDDGDVETARDYLDKVIDYKINVLKPSMMQKFSATIRDEDIEADLCVDALFCFIVQLEAVEIISEMTTDVETQIEQLKRVFTLSTEIDSVAEKYIQLLDDGRQNVGQYKVNRYDEHLDLIGCPGERVEGGYNIVPYLYRKKWQLINRLLIKHDDLYGYNCTYDLFDQVLNDYGAASEQYMKALMKAYMSFKGTSKYDYNSGMTYETFKQLASYSDTWSVSVITYSSIISLRSFERERFENAGNIVFESNGEYLYNPSFYDTCCFDGNRLVSFDGKNEVSQVVSRITYFDMIPIDKPLLCAILYGHHKSDVVPFILEAEQYLVGDTIVRKGYEDGYYKLTKRTNGYYEEQLYSDKNTPAQDESGVHVNIFRNGATVEEKYDINKKLIEYSESIDGVDYCYDGSGNLVEYSESIDGVKYYYDGGGRLKRVWGDDPNMGWYVIKYHYRDSITVAITQFLERNTTSVVKSYNIDPLLLTSSAELGSVIEEYAGMYSNLNDLESAPILSRSRYAVDGGVYYGPKGWSMESYMYDYSGNILQCAYEGCGESGGLMRVVENYDYLNNEVCITYTDENNQQHQEVKQLYRQ